MSPPDPAPIVVDAGRLVSDLGTIEALARIALAARRLGRGVALREASEELLHLIGFVGLGRTLGAGVVGQAEQREERVGVEEERELCDPGA